MNPILTEAYRLIDLGVDGDTIKQFLVLARMGQQFGSDTVWPSLETLGRMTGTKQEATVRRRNDLLVTHKAIATEPVPGRSTRYTVNALVVTPDPTGSTEGVGSTAPDLDPPEDQQPTQAVDPIREPKLSRWDGLVRRVERWGSRWKVIVRRAKSGEQPNPNPEPVGQSGELAPLEAGQPPAREEQPRPAVQGQTWGELFGTPEPSPDEALAAGKRAILKSIGLAPEGQWRYNEQILTTEALLAYPRIRAVITPDDLAEHRAANQPLGLRARL